MSRAVEEILGRILDLLLEEGGCRFGEFVDHLEGTSKRDISSALKLGVERLLVDNEGPGYYLNKPHYIKYVQEKIAKLSEKLTKVGWTCRA